jgi:hypothetical protein
MLSDLERQEIKAELHHYEQKRAACITALKIVQRHKSGRSRPTKEDRPHTASPVSRRLGTNRLTGRVVRNPWPHRCTVLTSVSCGGWALARYKCHTCE